MPGETFVVEGGGVSVSAFTVDYDAPNIAYTDLVFEKLGDLVDGTKQARFTTSCLFGAGADQLCSCGGEAGEPLDELWRKRVEAGFIAAWTAPPDRTISEDVWRRPAASR